MKVKLLSGTVIKDATIKKAPARLNRQYGFTKMAHWIDKDTGAPCSCPVKSTGIKNRWQINYTETLD